MKGAILVACFFPQQGNLVRQTLTCEEYGNTVVDFLDGKISTEENIDVAVAQYYNLEEIRNNIIDPIFRFCSKIVSNCEKNNIYMRSAKVNECVHKFKVLSEDFKKRIEFLELIQHVMTDDPIGFVKSNPKFVKYDIYFDFFKVSEEKVRIFTNSLDPEIICSYLENNDWGYCMKVCENISNIFLALHPLMEVDFKGVYCKNENSPTKMSFKYLNLKRAFNHVKKIKSQIVLPIYGFCNKLIDSNVFRDESKHLEKFINLRNFISNRLFSNIDDVGNRICTGRCSKKLLLKNKILTNNNVFTIIFKPNCRERNKNIISNFKCSSDDLIKNLESDGEEYAKKLYEIAEEIIVDISNYLLPFYPTEF